MRMVSKIAVMIVVAVTVSSGWSAAGATEPPQTITARLKVTTPLTLANVPMDPYIDFAKLLHESGATGHVDPNSVELVNLATGQPHPSALMRWEDKDRGQLAWVIRQPQEVDYEIRFRTSGSRVPYEPDADVPLIGTGDLLRYGAGVPRPITLHYGMALVDLDEDGKRDLAGCWNYAYRAGDPPSGIVCYRGIGEQAVPAADAAKQESRQSAWPLQFGELRRLRYRESAADEELKHVKHVYTSADFGDLNGDGHVDVVFTQSGTKTATVLLNANRPDDQGQPTFVKSVTIPVGGWKAVRIVDLNQDGALDLVVDGHWIQNTNPDGWPLTVAPPVSLDAGREPCFADLDRDGRLDAICLQGGARPQPAGFRVAWRRRLETDPPRFAAEQLLSGCDADWCSFVAAVQDGSRQALLVQHDVFQTISLYELQPPEPPRGLPAATVPAPPGEQTDAPIRRQAVRAKQVGSARSLTAVLALSDQAWPCVCDWDDDGDLDLLVGGGYGWPRILINAGTRARPSYAEPSRLLAAGRPVRFLRDEILGPPHHWHNMGYPYPELIDWDGDGRRDLVCANETNRIFWFPNIGTPTAPVFGGRKQLLVDGNPDSAEHRRRSAKLSLQDTYPREADRPFFWRTAPALADWNGDGLPDLITLSGDTREATLFLQVNQRDGSPRLARQPALRLTDGRPIDDRIVARRSHWTEAFRPCDWDGDGRIDLMYSLAGSHGGIQDGGSIYLLRNAGTRQEPVFEPPVTMRCFGEPIRITAHGPCARPCDYDGDGRVDLLACVEWSVYPFYRHAALAMEARPEFVFTGPARMLATGNSPP